MTDEGLSEAERRLAAIGACDRVLSHGKPASMRERLAALLEGGRDLDAVPDQYGDGIVRRLEERVAGLLGKPDAAAARWSRCIRWRTRRSTRRTRCRS